MTDKKYPSDLTDEEWEVIKVILLKEEGRSMGRPREVDLRRVWDAISYINKTGCQWEYLPHDFPPPTTVNYHDQKGMKSGLFERVHQEIRRMLRKKNGRNEEPSAGIIDSQSVKGTAESAEESGFDGGKKVKGRRHHIIVDTIGCVLVALVHAANIHDSKGAKPVSERVFEAVPTLRRIWADQGYRGPLVEWVKSTFSCKLDIVGRKGKKFKGIPRRWVVERTFAWLSRYRRLAREYEKKPASSIAMIDVASIQIMLKKLFPKTNEECLS